MRLSRGTKARFAAQVQLDVGASEPAATAGGHRRRLGDPIQPEYTRVESLRFSLAAHGHCELNVVDSNDVELLFAAHAVRACV